MTTERLNELIAASRSTVMTPDQEEEQRRSFAFGNANIENCLVTREVIDKAAQTLKEHGQR